MFRIKKYAEGYVVEVQKRKWWGKVYWVHFINVYGMPSQPWFFSSYEIAMNDLQKKIKWETMDNSVLVNL